VWSGGARHGRVWQERQGWVRFGMEQFGGVWTGPVRQERQGWVWLGREVRGMVRQERFGEVGSGMER